MAASSLPLLYQSRTDNSKLLPALQGQITQSPSIHLQSLERESQNIGLNVSLFEVFQNPFIQKTNENNKTIIIIIVS